MNFEDKPWIVIDETTADEFLLKMLELGTPAETSIIGIFDTSGRGSRRDIDLPLHRDGDYSAKLAEKNGQVFDKVIDFVGLYCLREGTSETLIEVDGNVSSIVLKRGQSVIFDNKKCRHGRKGEVKDRLLLRVWITK